MLRGNPAAAGGGRRAPRGGRLGISKQLSRVQFCNGACVVTGAVEERVQFSNGRRVVTGAAQERMLYSNGCSSVTGAV